MNFTILGLGYVGLSNALLLSRKNRVIGYDIDSKKINMLKNGISYIKDREITRFLKCKKDNLLFTDDWDEAVCEADYIVIAVPTDYDENLKNFDVSAIEKIIARVSKLNDKAAFLIKSTIPIGFVKQEREKLGNDNIIFIPEFLREGQALYDCLHPSRIIVGENSARGYRIAKMFEECSLEEKVEILLTGSSESEAIKLFSNAYLAMRVDYFNELDTFAMVEGLSTKEIILGMSLDSRIGKGYNNPSFGYGGYCLPKDSKELSANYRGIPNDIIQSIPRSNDTRKEFIINDILSKKVDVVGIYRLTMKSGSDNFKNSAQVEILKSLKKRGKNIIVYEPLLQAESIDKCLVIKSLQEFKELSGIILANRFESCLADVNDKVYTRDIFEYN